MSNVVPVVPVDLLPDTSRFVPLSPQCSPVSAEFVDQRVVESPELDAAVVCLDISTITSRFAPLNSRVSPVSMESIDRVVVESPTSDVALGGHLDISPVTDQFAPLTPQESQVSQLSSVQLSPNRVRLDFDMDTLDVFPVFPVSPKTDGYLPLISHVSSPGSPAAGSLLDEVALSRDSTIGSLATSLSITDHAANLQLLSPPLIPLPDTVLLHAGLPLIQLPDTVFLHADPALLL